MPVATARNSTLNCPSKDYALFVPAIHSWFLEFLRNLAEQYRYHDSGQFGEAFRQFMGESVEQRVRAVMVRQAAWAASR
jgi:hypothetical protein